MTANGTEHRILVGNRCLYTRRSEHIPSHNGEVFMLSQGKRIAREGGDIVPLRKRQFHQALTGRSSGSKDHEFHASSSRRADRAVSAEPAVSDWPAA